MKVGLWIVTSYLTNQLRTDLSILQSVARGKLGLNGRVEMVGSETVDTLPSYDCFLFPYFKITNNRNILFFFVTYV